MRFKIKLRIYLLVFLLLFLVASCAPKPGTKGSAPEYRGGTEGIIINFLDNNPRDSYLVSGQELLSAIVEIRNKGTYPQQDEQNILTKGKIYLSGFDENIIDLDEKSKNLNGDYLIAISSFNPEGSFDTAEFKGSIIPGEIADKYEPIILATICYPYFTKASPNVCIDPFPFDENQEKVCKIGSRTLTSQGAPIQITKIEEEASTERIRFKISIKNVGNGDVITLNSLDKCGSDEIFKREDFNVVELVRATAGSVELSCQPLDKRHIRLHNGEGFVICSLEKYSYDDSNTAYTTPLNIELRYGYRSTISKKITIQKATSIS